MSRGFAALQGGLADLTPAWVRSPKTPAMSYAIPLGALRHKLFWDEVEPELTGHK